MIKKEIKITTDNYIYLINSCLNNTENSQKIKKENIDYILVSIIDGIKGVDEYVKDVLNKYIDEL